MWGCPRHPVPPRRFISSVPQRLLQSLLLPPVIYHRGEVSVPWRIWIVPADFPLERGSSPFVFQSGLRTRSAGCQLDSRHPGSLPHGLSASSLLFPSFPPHLPTSSSSLSPSLLPLRDGKAGQIFQVYRKGSRTREQPHRLQ